MVFGMGLGGVHKLGKYSTSYYRTLLVLYVYCIVTVVLNVSV